MPFAKHQTFHIRESWLFKGMAAIKQAEGNEEPPSIFLDDDAPERLGIGRNMVQALRFWMQATGLTTEEWDGRKVQRLTPFGEWVWKHDRYLEDEGTLWLVHYHLACSEDQATTWYWFFNHFGSATFDADGCWEALKDWAITHQPNKRVSERSLKRDIDCLIRTYTGGEGRHTPEDLLECPLARLALMQEIPGAPKQYRLQRTDRRAIPPLVVLYVLLEQQRRVRPTENQVGLSQVLREPMNVGRIFNLSASVLVDILAELNGRFADPYRVHFVRTAGLDQLTLPAIDPAEVLAHYHDPIRQGVRA